MLPTADLTLARERLTQLGFTVAPNGLHPFGTENCCVYFADGTFLEPLAVADPTKAKQAAAQGNVFVARDQSWRSQYGEEGFSALVLGSGDADADHRQFVQAGVSAGNPLSFSRPFVDAAGKADVACFKLAFAADPRAPGVFFFTCERVNAPAVDRSALQYHPNGVVRIKAVRLVSGNPSDFADLMREIVGAPASAIQEGFRFALVNGDVAITAPASGARAPDGIRLASIVFGVGDLSIVSRLLLDAGVEHESVDDRITVPAASGQGAHFIFEGTR